MTCEHAVDLIIDSLLDSLSDEQERGLAEHIEQCRDCAVEADRMKAAWGGLAQLPAAHLGPGAAARSGVAVGSRATAGRHGGGGWRPLRAAASVALLLLGGMGGYLARGPGAGPEGVPAGGTTFLFLVRGEAPDARVSSDVLTAEYRAWAEALLLEGRLVGANKLMDEPGSWVSGPPTVDDRVRSDVQGYFLINAADYAEAEALAAASPHVRYGGTFEIREIEPIG